MNCPFCGNEMAEGEVQTGFGRNALINVGEVVTWVPRKECKKIIPKGTVSLKVNAVGYYCEQCAKAVAIFEERGDDFFQ